MNFNTDLKSDVKLKLQYQQQATITAIDEYLDDNCNKKDDIKDSNNLSESETRGLKEFKKKVNDGIWIVIQ